MSEFASYAVKRARKYVFGKSKQYVQTKVKQAVQAVERKAAQTIKRTAEDIVDKVSAKRQKTMPARGLINAKGANRRRGGMSKKYGKRRKFSRALRKRRSGYNRNSLKRAMRKIALDASETKRLNGGTGYNLSTGDVQHTPLNGYQTSIFALTSNLRSDVDSGTATFNGQHFFLKGINIAGQVTNNSASAFRVGIRIFIFKDEVSGFDYTTVDPQVSQELLWYNRTLGTGSSFLALPEPFKSRPKLMKGQNAKMVWSQYFELDYAAAGGLNASDMATFKKYLPINREMYLKTKNQNRPQCQWWFGATWHKLDMEQEFAAPSAEGGVPDIGFISTIYFKDP